MPVVAEIRGWRVVSGPPDSGSLPVGASEPRQPARREVVVDVRIEYDEGDYYLQWLSPDRSERGEAWHQSLSDAKAQAELELGIPPSAWRRPG